MARLNVISLTKLLTIHVCAATPFDDDLPALSKLKISSDEQDHKGQVTLPRKRTRSIDDLDDTFKELSVGSKAQRTDQAGLKHRLPGSNATRGDSVADARTPSSRATNKSAAQPIAPETQAQLRRHLHARRKKSTAQNPELPNPTAIAKRRLPAGNRQAEDASPEREPSPHARKSKKRARTQSGGNEF